MFGKLFGKAKDTGRQEPKAADTIRVYDEYGRERLVNRENWRANVLPAAIEASWNNPEQLYANIVQALRDGFRPEIVYAAEHLYQIDPQKSRGAAAWGIVLMEEGRLEEAESVFQEFLSRHGDDGVVLTNLAKVYSKRNDEVKSQATLWHALEIDPNLDNGLAWYGAIHRDRGGDQAWLEAMQKVASLPGSWRAQLWLARDALQATHKDEAMALYRSAFERLPVPVPADFLLQITGDLGRAGLLREAITFGEPGFVPEIHGLAVGNNLIKAHLDLGETTAARKIVDLLYSQKRPDWQKTLSFWDTELAKAALVDPAPGEPLNVSMLFGTGPVWLAPGSPGTELFPEKTGAVTVTFLGSSAEGDDDPQDVRAQLADARGRLSRAIPLFLAEQLDFGSSARSHTLLPYLVGKSGAGFVVSGKSWPEADAIRGVAEIQDGSTCIAILHLKCLDEPWQLDLRLVRASDSVCIGTLSVALPAASPEAAILELNRLLLEMLSRSEGVSPVTPPACYQIPSGTAFADYLLRLEQLLAVRCAAMEGVPATFLSGAREIINGNIRLCLDHPQNLVTRLLLAKTVQAMKRVRPDILAEFAGRLAALQKANPLPQPQQEAIQAILDDALAA